MTLTRTIDMDPAQLEANIALQLDLRGKKVVNRNAIRALFGAISDPLNALGAIFLGRQDALDAERTRLQQDAVLELLCKLDDALSAALASSGSTRTILAGLIETEVRNGEEATGVDLSGQQVTFEPGTHIRTIASDVRRVTGLKL